MTTVVSKPRILVVEDEVIVARDIQLQLVELGYEAVGHATRGDRAIVLCGELRPDLVLMDIQLAGPLDGIAAAQAIRTQFALPVVFLTALAEDDTLARAKLAEPLGYILKPFSERELRTTIEMALYRHQAEAKQRLSDHALKAVSQGVIITGIDQLIVSCNDAFVKITGYPKAEVLGRNCRFLQGPLTDPLTLKAIRLALLHQTDFSGEILNYRNDGVPFWNELTISPVRDAQGRATHFIGVTRDITPRKRADEKLRLSEESLAITLQSIGDAVIATNADGLITRLNATAERLTGWRWADAAGRSLSEVFRIFNSQTREAVKDPVQLVMERGEVVGLANHTVLLARDGSEYQIADSAAPIRDPAGQIVGVVLVFSDVTEAYRLRQTLERTANLLERTGEMAQVGGWELDLRTMLHLWSLETCRIFDVEPPGVPAVEQGFKFCAPAARPIIQAAVQAAIDTGAPYNLELPVITAKGRSIWVRAQGSAILEDGKVVKLIGAFQDITARKQAEESLRKNETQLLQATKMEALGKLSGGIAHDFNNLLTVILGHSEFALERLLPADPLRVNLEQIQAAGQRAAKLTQQLLAFSRKQVLQPKVVDLNQIVASVATLLRRIIGEDVQMEVVAARELWPVKADPDQLAQVLMNLAVNARDAMPQGGSITITTENVGSGNDPGLESGGQVRFTVSDTGMGMDETTLGHLFEPFFTTKALGKGTGLGLTTVYGIVKQSGGTLRVHSAPGRGSTFEVNLPRAVHEAVTLPVVASTQTLRGSETILLVEDEAPVRSVVHLMLAA